MQPSQRNIVSIPFPSKWGIHATLAERPIVWGLLIINAITDNRVIGTINFRGTPIPINGYWDGNSNQIRFDSPYASYSGHLSIFDDPSIRIRHYILSGRLIMKPQLGIDIIDVPGAGGAGGLGAGLLAFTNSTMKRGIEIVIEYTKLKEKVKSVDYCFTGEGGIDFQTKFGKTPYGVAQAVKSVNPDIKVIALAGYIGKDVETLYNEGFEAIFGIVPGAADIDTLLAQGRDNVTRTSENIARLLRE